MKTNLKHSAIALLLLSTLAEQSLHAQGEATLIGSRVDPIRIAQNPAYISEERVVIGLGLSSLSTSVQSPLSVSQLLTKMDDGSSKVYVDEVLTRLGDKTATTEISYSLFLLGLRTKAGFFTLGANLHMQSEGGADRKLTDFFATGNGAYRGNQVVTKGLTADAESHLELNLGYASDRLLPSRRLSIGGRMKVLFGQQSMRSQRGELNFLTSQDGHELLIEGYQRLHLRLPHVQYSYDALGLLDRLDIGFGESPRPTFANLGFGLDLGASYRLADELTLGLSVRNLGFIKWTGGHIITLDKRGDNALRFRGVDISPVLVSKTDEDKGDKAGFEALGEEIRRHLTVESNAAYTTPLPTKLHAMAEYQPLRWLSLSTLVGVSKLGSHTRPDLALAVNCLPTRGIGAHLSLSSLHGSPINLGAGLVFGRRIQLHIAVDNLLMLDLNNAKYAHLSAGLNFRF